MTTELAGVSAEDKDKRLFEDMNLDTDLDGFYSGVGNVNLTFEPMPTAFGSEPAEQGAKPASSDGPSSGGNPSAEQAQAAAAAGIAAAAGAAATALMGDKLKGNIVGEAVSNMALAAVPTSLAPLKDKTGAFLAKAQPWKDFCLPLSVPTSTEVCSRLTGNLYCFQTNYAILLVVQLLASILLQPSALLSIVVVAAVWILFLKKNQDPDWKPVVGGTELGPIQRWLALASSTILILFIMAGSVISNALFMYLLFALLHGCLHDPAKTMLPGKQGEEPIPL